MQAHALRLEPGDDLRPALERFVATHDLEAAFVVSCAGSLSRATLRLADGSRATVFEGPLEIVALGGTLSRRGGAHLHLAAADGTGRTFGGHLLTGSEIHTTAEVVLGEAPTLTFDRQLDPRTGYRELVIGRRGDDQA